ncbi:hypothetical protein [Chondrinema litorale]|uniref:hypothetical protein n=1 Tax=Chondrinema litorale TaxID=2994555 RepID=UPI002543F733|nr:hypothetical protein [Chondrinema litorale]UZR94021.1 hypothetical protein OQ292_19450 [Chondrinema litorale]
MTKIRVEIDRPDPPKEKIRKYKNYNKFQTEYHKFHSQHGIRELWYRDKKKLAYIAIIVVLVLLWILSE